MTVNERGDIVIGWLVKLVVSLAIVGLVAFEGGAIVVARVQSDGVANDVATEAAIVYARGANEDAARKAAEAEAEHAGVELVAFAVTSDGGHISVTVLKKATTLLFHRIGATKSWTEARSTRTRAVITN